MKEAAALRFAGNERAEVVARAEAAETTAHESLQLPTDGGSWVCRPREFIRRVSEDLLAIVILRNGWRVGVFRGFCGTFRGGRMNLADGFFDSPIDVFIPGDNLNN